MEGKIIFSRYGFTAVLIGALAVGYIGGVKASTPQEAALSALGAEVPESVELDFSPFWTAWQVLDQKFVASKEKPAADKRLWGAIQGMTDSFGDPYTVFMPPAESEEFQAEIAGNFEGVGMEVGTRDGVLTVVAPLKGSPAERAGVKPGDKIIAIDGKPSADMAVDAAVKLIRGEGGTTVKLSLAREGEKAPLEVSIVRAVIQVPTINTELRSDGIFVISLYNFYADSHNLFRGALREFIESGSDKLIIDLRGNPGGYLEASVDMASWFLPAGKVIVTEDYGGNATKNIHRSKGYDIFSDRLKLAIIADQGSASASEILSGALRDHGIAKLFGERTFGKGSVQEVINITEDTTLKVTVARWLTPGGYSISDGGLEPDFKVESRTEKADAPLLRAAEYLLTGK